MGLLNLILGKNKDELPVRRWCCVGFQSGYGRDKNERGFSYDVGLDSLGDLEFREDCRSVDAKDESGLVSQIPLSLVTGMRIVFCPSCGTNLEKWYGPHVTPEQYEALKVGDSNVNLFYDFANPLGW